MPQQRIVFRVDASKQIGTGHVMRCLCLAEQLRRYGAWVAFVCRLHEGHLSDLIESKKFILCRLENHSGDMVSGSGPQHMSWLGTDWETDCGETAKCIASFEQKPDWVIVDHYALDHKWERQIRSVTKKIMVIDDLADRAHDCDLLLDQNIVENGDYRYSDIINEGCQLLLGPDYALLQPEYARLHKDVVLRSGKIKRIFIFLGGVDLSGFIAQVLESIVLLEKQDIQIDLVLGNCSNTRMQIESLVKAIPKINIYQNLPSLSLLMMTADLAIGACGVTTWERMCLGLPSIVVTVAYNQEEIARYLDKNNLVKWLGRIGEIGLTEIQSALTCVIEAGIDESWSGRCHELVDGKGVYRAAVAVLLDAQSMLFPRQVTEADEQLLLEWANDPETRNNAFCKSRISPEEHHKWFHGHLRDKNNCQMYVVETEDRIPVGQVRFQRIETNQYEVHYSLDKVFRGRRIGGSLLRTALNDFLNVNNEIIVIAKVLNNNISSQKIFNHLHFTKCEQMSTNEMTFYQFNQKEK